MKKLLYVGMLAIAVSCLLASCAAANEEMAEMPMNEKKEVTLTTSLDLASRATMVDENLELFYTVYDAGNGAVVEKNTAGLQSVSFEGNASVTLTLQLEESKTYDIAFWAQPKGQTCYDLSDMKAIKLRYEECHCNDSLRKAFYGSVFGLRVKDQTTATVSLKSPFSTLEVLTTVEDVKAVGTMGYDVDQMQSAIRVSGVANTFNALYGTTEGEAVEAQLQPGKIPSDIRQIDGKDYRVLTTDHLLAKDRETVEVEVTLSHPEIEKQPLVFTAGRAWLRQNQTTTLANHYMSHPIEFEASVNDWLLADASLNL